jgi:hypothetical protein
MWKEFATVRRKYAKSQQALKIASREGILSRLRGRLVPADFHCRRALRQARMVGWRNVFRADDSSIEVWEEEEAVLSRGGD